MTRNTNAFNSDSENYEMGDIWKACSSYISSRWFVSPRSV